MKRLIGILVLVAAVIVTLIVVAGAAETEKNIVFTADMSEAQVGDTITVTLSLEGFEDCDTFMFYDPIYNEDALEWVGGEWLIDGLMSDYYTEAEMNGGAEGRSGVLYAEDAIALEAADVVNFRFEVLEETGAEEISFSVIAKNGDTVLSENAEVVTAQIMLGESAEEDVPVPTTNKHSVNYQVGLIEPWFVRINFTVKTSDKVQIDYDTFSDYGAYAIRKSDLDNADVVIADKLYDDILNNENTISYTKGVEVGVEEADNHAVFRSGNYLSMRYREGLYTYEMSDPIVYFFWYRDSEGLHYSPIVSKAISELVAAGKDNTNYGTLERDVYEKMYTLENDILTYRSQFDEIPELVSQTYYTVADSDLGTPNADVLYKFSRSLQTILIEPWGLRINASAKDADTGTVLNYNALEDCGIIIYHSPDKQGPADAAAMLNEENAFVFSMENGNAFIEGNYFCARYNQNIFTYQLDTALFYTFYVKVDGQYYYSSVANTNIKGQIEKNIADTSGKYGEEELNVYKDMVALYQSITTYREDYFN